MYRAKPISQRDGSALANSNCRMASIASGLDFDTLGKKRSTGSKMRSYTVDQSGGTDSGDATQAWQRGYTETLVVRDGRTWADALVDLRAGRLVHIDVWHTFANICVSGTGQYGHTMAIAPEQHTDGRWLVSDPWCLPAKWAWLSERQLREGAEAWGRKIFETSGRERDWPTGGGWPREEDPDDVRWAILRRIVKALMTRYHADGDEDPEPPPTDTGGPQRILYTTTAAHPEDEGGDEVAGVQLTMVAPYDGTAVVQGNGHSYVRIWDGHVGSAPADMTKPVFAKAKLKVAVAGIPAGTAVVLIGTDEAFLLQKDVTLTPKPGPDLAGRDAEWEAWVLKGSPVDEAGG